MIQTKRRKRDMEEKIKIIERKKQELIKGLPSLKKVLRGTFIEWYQVCARANCKCHKDKKYRHGPFYRVSYSKGGRSHHIYVSSKEKKQAEEWTENYNKLWEGIEAISELNIQILKEKSKI